MATVNYDVVLKMAERLSESEQNKLIYQLRVKQVADRIQAGSVEETESIHDEWYTKRGSEYVEYYHTPTREELIEELNNLRDAGTFSKVESLYGKYANPVALEMTEEEFHADLHAIATEWEQELDEFDDD